MSMRSDPKKKRRAGILSRRDFLRAGALALGACMCPKPLLAALDETSFPERCLSFYNIHTGEALNAVYWSVDGYVPEALDDINHILRDFRTGEIKPIEPDLLDLLHTLRTSLGTQESLHVISGYRSPETNAVLREKSLGVAEKSLHIEGRAADIRLPGYSTRDLHQAALALGVGGVGYYPTSDFVHVDTGPVRSW